MVLSLEEHDVRVQQPYKVGLIDVGAKFAQSILAWLGIADGNLNFHGNIVFIRRLIAYANVALHQSAQVIIHRGTRYVEFCLFWLRRI